MKHFRKHEDAETQIRKHSCRIIKVDCRKLLKWHKTGLSKVFPENSNFNKWQPTSPATFTQVRSPPSMTQVKRTPTVLWAQRSDKLFVTLEIQDAQKGTLNANENSIKYSCQSSSEEGDFEVDLEFYDSIEPSGISEHVSGHNIEFVIPKARKMEPFWPRLLKSKVKHPFIKTDFTKWQDEEEEDDDAEAVNPYGNFASSFDPSSFDPSQFDASQYDEHDDDDEEEELGIPEKDADLANGKEKETGHVHNEHCCH